MPYFEVNAFTRRPFGGNPAGVCLPEHKLPDTTMINIARQNNLPATAFVHQTETGFGIRWFTPKAELPLCGHASLASAHILYEIEKLPLTQKILFESNPTPFYAQSADGWIELDFPACDYAQAPIPAKLKPMFNRIALSAWQTSDRYIIELKSAAEVKNFVPDFQLLHDYKCILTAVADSDSPYDFVSRYFACPDGVMEDAVTGSSHCSLAPYWADRLGKTTFQALQVSSREGELRISLKDKRVLIAGQAVTIVAGKMMI